MKRILFVFLSFIALLGSTFYVTGCSSDSGSSVTTTNYAGPGSSWSVALNSDNTFVITYAETVGGDVELTVNGTYTTTTSGYLKLTVTSSDGVDGPTAGDQAYAVNIPGFVFLLKPMSNDGEIIPMIATGTCPTSTLNFNWMVTSHEDSGNGNQLYDGRDLVGTASFDGTDTLTLGAKYDLENDSLGAGDTMTGSCSNGIISITSPETVNIWLSPSEAALVQVYNGANDSVIVAMPQETLSAASDLNGDYYGILFNEAVDENSDSETQPVWMTISGGNATAGGFTDVDAGTKDNSDTVSYAFTANSPANGFISGTLTAGADTTPMTCQTTLDVNGSGKNLIFCVGIDPESNTSGDADQLYTALFISQ